MEEKRTKELTFYDDIKHHVFVKDVILLTNDSFRYFKLMERDLKWKTRGRTVHVLSLRGSLYNPQINTPVGKSGARVGPWGGYREYWRNLFPKAKPMQLIDTLQFQAPKTRIGRPKMMRRNGKVGRPALRCARWCEPSLTNRNAAPRTTYKRRRESNTTNRD